MLSSAPSCDCSRIASPQLPTAKQRCGRCPRPPTALQTRHDQRRTIIEPTSGPSVRLETNTTSSSTLDRVQTPSQHPTMKQKFRRGEQAIVARYAWKRPPRTTAPRAAIPLFFGPSGIARSRWRRRDDHGGVPPTRPRRHQPYKRSRRRSRRSEAVAPACPACRTVAGHGRPR